MPIPRLLERGEELAEIAGALGAAAAGTGRVVIVEGAAGVGKTVLLRAAARAAGGQGHLVLEGSGVALEQELAWGVVRGVFGELLSSVSRRRRLLTDTLDGDDDAIVDGDRGDERPNDQRVGSGNGLAMKRGVGSGSARWCVAR